MTLPPAETLSPAAVPGSALCFLDLEAAQEPKLLFHPVY